MNWTLGKILALAVAITCLVLIVLAVAGVGAAIPAWIVFALVGILAAAVVIG